MTLTNVQEQISSIGFNLELCRIVFSGSEELGASRSRTWTELVDKIEKINNVEVNIVQVKASQDEEALLNKVILELGSLEGEEKQVAEFLLIRLKKLKVIKEMKVHQVDFHGVHWRHSLRMCESQHK